MKKEILVIGATGNQGRSVIRALRKHHDFSIRGLVRNPESEAAKRLKREGVDLVTGDLDDRNSLEQAMKGIYGVFSYQNMADGVKKEEDRGKWVAHVFRQFDPFQYQEIEIAGDELTCTQIEAAYIKVEGKKPMPVPFLGAFLSKLGDTGKLSTWMWHEGYQADLRFCRETIKDTLSFEQWLALKKSGSAAVTLN